MAFRGYKEASRDNWGGDAGNAGLSLEQINTGAILRIADAVEKMAQRYTELIAQRDHFERRYGEERNRTERLERSNAALRGHLKRAKAKLSGE